MLGTFVSTVITTVGSAVIGLMAVELYQNQKLEEKLRNPSVNEGPDRFPFLNRSWWTKENPRLRFFCRGTAPDKPAVE